MTPRFDAWLLSLQNRDHTLVLLTLIAVSLVLAWCLLDNVPSRIRPWLRQFYLWAGLPLYVLTILVSVVKH